MSMLPLKTLTPLGAGYQTAPDVDMTVGATGAGSGSGEGAFIPDFWLFKMTVASTQAVVISFDGTNDHLFFDFPAAATPAAWLYITTHARKLWIRRGAGGAGGVLMVGAGTNS